MEISDEKQSRVRSGSAEEPSPKPTAGTLARTDLATPETQFTPFGDDDPYRPERSLALSREIDSFFAPMGGRGVGYGDVDAAQLTRLSKDAEERSRWPETTQDGFRGLLRLGRPTPPRSARIL